MSSEAAKVTPPSRLFVAAARKLTFAISRLIWRIEFHNTEHIPGLTSGGIIIASNHPTYFDPFWISLPIKMELRFLAWDRAFDWPLCGGIIGRLGAIPMSLESGGTLPTLKHSLKLLSEGCGIVVFPEGEREFEDGALLTFKTGAVQLAAHSGVPILPVTIVGGSRIWPRGKTLPGLGKVDIYFHPVFRINELENSPGRQEFMSEQTDSLRRIIGSRLNKSD